MRRLGSYGRGFRRPRTRVESLEGDSVLADVHAQSNGVREGLVALQAVVVIPLLQLAERTSAVRVYRKVHPTLQRGPVGER